MKKHLPLKIFTIFFLTLIMGGWIMQNNIENYWQQTYHRPSAIFPLQQYSWWRKGEALRSAVTHWLNPDYEEPESEQNALFASNEGADVQQGSGRAAAPEDFKDNMEDFENIRIIDGSDDIGIVASMKNNDEKYAQGADVQKGSGRAAPEAFQDNIEAFENIKIIGGTDNIGILTSMKNDDEKYAQGADVQINADLGSGRADLNITFPEEDLNAEQLALNLIPLDKIADSAPAVTIPAVLSFLDPSQQTLAADTLAALPVRPSKPTIHAGKRVFLAGDSMMQGFAPYIQRDLLKHKVKAINMGKPSTGLRYPAYYNWPKTVESVLSEHDDIEIMMVFLGPNDPWDVQDPHNKRRNLRFKTPEWEAFYRGEIRKILDSAAAHEVQVIWIGPPIMRKESYSKRVMYLDSLIADEVEKAGQFYVDTKAPFTDAKGNYSKYITHNGKKVSVRQNDGVHINIAGCKILSEIVMEQIEFVE